MGLFDRHDTAAPHARRLFVHVDARVEDAPPVEYDNSVPIPPGYDAADVQALTVRKIEDAAFTLTMEAFGRAPTRAALIAYVARVRGIEAAVEVAVDLAQLRAQIQEIIETDNATITALWGEDTEGD